MSEKQEWHADKYLVLYDGHCGMCDATVQWILKHDSAHQFQMAPLQGVTAAEILSRHPELPADLDSILLVQKTAGGESITWESGAFFRIAAQLDLPWRLLRLGALFPRWVSDPVYRFVARHRLKVFGRLDTCRIPDATQINRFLP